MVVSKPEMVTIEARQQIRYVATGRGAATAQKVRGTKG